MVQGVRSRLWAGGLAGGVATVVQTAAMEAVRRRLPGGTPGRFPPRQVTEALVARLAGGRRRPAWSEPTWWALTAVSHFGFGVAAGAIYPLLPPVPRSPAARGAVFGLAVGALHYGVLFPLLGIHAPQADRPVRKVLALTAAHLAWGIVTAVLYERWGGRSVRDSGRGDIGRQDFPSPPSPLKPAKP